MVLKVDQQLGWRGTFLVPLTLHKVFSLYIRGGNAASRRRRGTALHVSCFWPGVPVFILFRAKDIISRWLISRKKSHSYHSSASLLTYKSLAWKALIIRFRVFFTSLQYTSRPGTCIASRNRSQSRISALAEPSLPKLDWAESFKTPKLCTKLVVVKRIQEIEGSF